MELATTLNYKVDNWFLQKRVDKECKTTVNGYGWTSSRDLGCAFLRMRKSYVFNCLFAYC